MRLANPCIASLLERLGFGQDHSEAVADTLRNAFSQAPTARPLPEDHFYLANLRNLAHSPQGSSVPSPRINAIDASTDFLGSDGFTLLKAINLAAMACQKPERPVALIATCRNEGPFLVEWIAHHRTIGFDEIVLYTNDNTDGSDELLQALARAGHIRLVTNAAGKQVNPQIKAYEHALMFDADLRRYRWWMTLDIDEFLIIDERFDSSIQSFIASLEDKGATAPDCVCFNWFWMGSHGAIRRSKENVTDRFPFGAAAVPFVKSLFRPDKTLSLRSVHKPTLVADASIVDTSFHPVGRDSHDIPFEFNGGRINHYWQKSFEEFLVKQRRGVDRSVWERGTELFFDWDIPVSMETAAAPPAALRDRVHSKQNMLLADPAIRLAQLRVDAEYAALATSFASGAIDKTYHRAAARCRLLKRLSAACQHMEHTSPPNRGLRSILRQKLEVRTNFDKSM